MRYLRIFSWCLVLITLGYFTRIQLNNIFPAAAPFISNLVSLLQLLILLFTILLLLFDFFYKGKRKLLILSSLVLACTLLPELLIAYWLHHPRMIPSPFRKAFQYYYSESARNIIQLNPESGTYDSALFYTLKKSSTFTFSNYEFSNKYHTNSLGLRDDEGSLQKPDIICLGDSYAMGWGVEQGESFAEQLASRSGYNVLNAAISSYGTARELINLSKLDTSNLRYIILQYCQNDFEENETYIRSNYTLPISPKTEYDSAVLLHHWNTYWFPGKHLIGFSKLNLSREAEERIFKSKKNTQPALPGPEQRAKIFLELLYRSGINFSRIRVFVLDLNDRSSISDDFINRTAEMARSDRYATRFNNNLVMVPVTKFLTDKDYYILDPHLKPGGHRKIAERLYELISATR